ncbi:MAG: hypothetical protein ABJB10_06000, partial [Mesorhizobium sp.]
PDDYVVIATVQLADVEQPFTVKTGEFLDLKVAMNAGVLSITAPGAKKIEIFDIKKDINGNRKSIGYNYDAAFQTTLPAGDYAIVADTSDNGSKEGTATVKAGERVEVTVK